MLAENTLLKTACHFLLLLVGFDTLTYRKDYDRSPILVGHHIPSSISLPASPFTRSVMYHPATNSLVTLLARHIVMCITERAQRYLSDTRSDKS